MRVAALVPDPLFGSEVEAMLEQAGHRVALLAVRARAPAAGFDLARDA